MKKILILIFIFLLCGCSYDEYKMPKDAYINVENKTFDIYDTHAKIRNVIKDTNTEILNKKEKIDTTKLGENTLTIKYKYKNKRRIYKYDVNYNVVDTQVPIFLSASTTRTIYKGDQVNFCEKISYIDNYDNNVKCKIDGEFDSNIPGTYNLKYVLEDNSNNISEKDLIVYVIEKNTTSSNSNNKPQTNTNYTPAITGIQFMDIVKKHKNTNTMVGIDVSYWQQNVDYKKVKKAGCEFVIIRLGVNTDNDKDISEDSFYKKNIENAKKAGLKVGVYIYSTAATEKQAKEHAKWTKKILNKEKLDFPVAFDFENWSSFPKYNLSRYSVTKNYLAFDKEMKKSGYKTMLYSSMNYLDKVWMFNDTYPVWLAHYTDQTTYEGKYIMWQMTDRGIIDGINGNVDIDIYYKE